MSGVPEKDLFARGRKALCGPSRQQRDTSTVPNVYTKVKRVEEVRKNALDTKIRVGRGRKN